MTTREPYHKAYVLWLVREGIATTWNELCSHFHIEARVRATGQAMLLDTLQSLQKAQLLQTEEGYLETFSTVEVSGDVPLSVTELLAHIQNALKLSLKDLARSDPAQRLLVTPVLSQTFSSRYQSDILVLMPFADQMRPVYEDHMMTVARKLGMSIARADDFFTSERIMDEIWTAMVNAKTILADCTGRNPNVFYEIGLAHALGKPTILITQNDDDVPFDLRHRRYIKYSYTPRGMKEFEESLESTINTIEVSQEEA
jgi:nucleoside 2-deoxyribosyltransferase